MPPPDQGRSLRRISVVLVLLLLIVLVARTCRQPAPERRDQVVAANPGAPSPAPPQMELRAGLEIISPNLTGSLITVRDRATGRTVQIPRADFSPQAVDQAFARLVTQQPEAVANRSSPPGASTAAVAPAPLPAPAQPALPSAGLGAAGGPKPPAAVVTRRVVDENLPDFVPLYPGATTIKIASSRDHGRLHGDYEFSTADSPDSIGKYYAKSAGDGGLMIVVDVAGTNANGSTFTLIAEDTAANKSLSLTATVDRDKSRGSIEFVSK